MAWIRSLPLSSRVAALLAIALLPLGLIAVHQTNQTLIETEMLERRAFLAMTDVAAQDEQNLMKQTLGQALALGEIAYDLRDDRAACRAVLSAFVDRSSDHVFAGFIPKSGLMECTSNGGTEDFSQSETFADAIGTTYNRAAVRQAGSQTGLPVIIISAPIIIEGTWVGFLSISVPTQLMRAITANTPPDDIDFNIALMDNTNTVFAMTDASADNSVPLPVNLSDLDRIQQGADTFVSQDQYGDMRIFAGVPIFGDQIFGISSQIIDNSASGITTRFTPVLFPVIMWMVSLIVAFLAVDRLVIRHVKRLEGYMIAYAHGARDLPHHHMDDAPGELRNLGLSLRDLIQKVTDDEAKLERALDEKSVLLKEVYHRVKNNLQLISSITNMQIRMAHTPDARAALLRVQERVMSLAAVHRMLYTAASLTQVRADHLVEMIINQVTMLSDDQRKSITVKTELDTITLYPDQAMPLALLVSEAATNAIKHMSTSTAPSTLSFTLTIDEADRIHIAIVNTLHETTDQSDTPAAASDGLGSQLIEAFAGQLDAEMAIETTGGVYSLVLEFERSDFQEEVNT